MINNEDLLARVEKPGRYAGGELNAIIKGRDGIKVSFALAFPDVYEVGMSYPGFKILYHVLNGLPFVQAERVYAPWTDMEALMRSKGRRLAALETGRELSAFDLVGFTLQYELTYSNIVNMLDLGAVAVLAAARGEKEPFVVGGGPCVFNPEPLADFFDFFIVGDGEELIVETAAACRDWKEAGRPGGRRGFLEVLARLPGIYVPCFYQAEYTGDGRFKQLTAQNPAAPPYIKKRAVKNLDAAGYPTAPVVPFNEIIHDRIALEVFRGCTRGCRFCHAGMVYRPLRERSVAQLKRLARGLVDSTGYNEISLISLSTADYSCLAELLADLSLDFARERVSVSLPSLRLDSFSIEVAQKVSGVRKSGLTFAPEAGTQRLRDVINKGVSEENVLAATSAAFAAGWSSLKLYFMIGLPTETFADLKGIADLAFKVIDAGRRRSGRRDVKATVSVSPFVPKPWTPFQWAEQDSVERTKEKQLYLKSLLCNSRALAYQYHDPQAGALEGLFARGDRRLGRVIVSAWRKGARFDGWSEHFDYGRWRDALSEHAPAAPWRRAFGEGEPLPWDHVRPGVAPEYLLREWKKALKGETTPDCRQGCAGCGVCPALGVGKTMAAR
ncbi:MAG: TIGR03960 family B12-binding radical SAM protein [Acidaminococcales bacterium]|jgi:radical SAM family uncharacterized protein|nr:TIGR03960 family B12-binding radical SAM protein [Acidaminococcales bacterium]